jgi:hypothetical protein
MKPAAAPMFVAVEVTDAPSDTAHGNRESGAFQQHRQRKLACCPSRSANTIQQLFDLVLDVSAHP